MLIFSLSSGLFADSTDLLTFHRQLMGYGEKREGTKEEGQAFDDVAERLDKLGISYERRTLDRNRRGHSFSEILEATIPGSSPERYVLASPMEGAAFSAALLLEIAESLAITPPQHTVTLFFLGGERGDTPYHPYGSRYAVETIEPGAGAFVLYIDADTIPKTWDVRIGGNGVVAPFWLTKTLVDFLFSESIPHRLRGADIHVANLGLQGDIGSYSQWLAAGIPTVAFQGRGTSNSDNMDLQIDRFVRALLDADHLVFEDLQKQERTYLYVHPFAEMKPRFIRELPFVLFASGLVSLLLASILLRYRSVHLNFRRFSKFWWTWPLLFFFVFLFLFLSTLFIEEIGRLTDFPTLWTYSPGTFLFFKFTVIAALSLNFILLTHGIPLPRAPHFYSYGAVTSSFLLTLVCMLLDITMASYSLGITSALLFFAVVKNLKAKLFFLILALIPYIMIFSAILTQPYMAVWEFLLLNRIFGNLLNTLALLPIILAIASLNYWQPHYRSAYRKALVSPATLVMSLAAVITLTWLPRLAPFDKEHLQPVKLTDHIDLINNERWLNLESPGPIGNAEFIVDGELYRLEELGRQASIRTEGGRAPLSIESSGQSFLGRQTIDIELSGEKQPHRLHLEIRSANPFTLHSASMPFEMAPSGQTAAVFVGDNPPFPLNFQLTVSSKAEITLSVMAVWRNPQDAAAIERPDLKVEAWRTAYGEYTL